MKKFRLIILGLLMAITITGCSGGSSSGSTIDKIKDADVLRVGVKDDRVGFGIRNTETGEYEGYEIEIAKAIAEDILGDPDKIEYVAVNANTRTNLLDNNEIDCVVATFTITDERKQSWNFSDPYYEDYVGIMCKKGAYSSLADMDGATVAIQQSTTSKDAIEAAAKDLNITLKYNEYSTASECATALNSGVVDAWSIDVTQLMSYQNDDLEILPDRFEPQQFGIATRLNDQEMTDEVEKVIKQLQEDGTLDKWQEEFNIKQGV